MLYKVLENIRDVLNDQKEYLTDLDRAIGDGDHGINMARGFNTVTTKIGAEDDLDISNTLKQVGMTLISTIGGASGPLYGSAFLMAAMAARNKTEVDTELVGTMIFVALKSIKERGKAVLGDKTMIDALEPAYVAYKEEEEQGGTIVGCLEKACEAARLGLEGTRDIIAKKGRASYLGERSIGHQDPGATSVTLILESITQTLKDGCGEVIE